MTTTAPAHASPRLTVGRLSIDPRSKEAWKDGSKLHLPHQSLEILVALMERPGKIVTREELQHRLWPEGTFVDFDHSLNAAVKKLRLALGDSAERPQFIDTLPRVGYRLVTATDRRPSIDTSRAATSPKRRAFIWCAGATTTAVLVAGASLSIGTRSAHTPAPGATVERLTSLGNVVSAAISPDGKYLSYITRSRSTVQRRVG